MKASFFIICLAVPTLIYSGCSGTSAPAVETDSKRTDVSTPQAFDAKNLKPGTNYIWQGQVTIHGEVFVGTDTDGQGNVLTYLANVTNRCENKSLLGESGKQAVVEGVLHEIAPIFERPQMAPNPNKTILLVLADCKVRFPDPDQSKH